MPTKDNNSSAKKGHSSAKSSTSSSTQTTQSSEKSLTLEKLFEDGLKDIYDAETQLLQALPKMAYAAENEELQEAFEQHEKETKRQIERLEKIFNRLKIDKSDKEPCEAMKGLIEENNQVISEYPASAVRDSALIIGAQKVEHYEMAAYGSLCELADVLGHSKIADILHKTFEEEQNTDELLSELAEDINDEALETSHSEHHEVDTERENQSWFGNQ